MNKGVTVKVFFLFLLLCVVVLVALTHGAVSLSLSQLLAPENRSILLVRVIRVLTALIAGSGLAVAGVVLQALLRNPLAEPYLLGTSSGAGLGAVAALVLGVSSIYLPLASFIGSAASILLVYGLAREHSRISEQSLILSGVIVSVACSAVIVFLVSIFPDATLHGMTWWLWGGLQSFDLKLVTFVGCGVFSGIACVWAFSQDLNAMSLGEEEAIHLGIPIETVKKILLFICSFMAAGIVCVSGVIGFVGLLIPHIMRFLVGPNHRALIPAACIGGSVFLVVCDLIARSLIPPFEFPIGVITALIGVPVFIILLKREQHSL
jgi:iron complex transport system permease protein